MKLSYFKHYPNAHEGSSLMRLFDEFSHAGPCCYWIMVELCAGKLEKEPGALYTEADCVFRFHERLLREKFRLGSAKVQAWLNQSQTLALLSFKKTGSIYEISMPKLLEILDRDSKRARPERGSAAPRNKKEEDKKQEHQPVVVSSSEELIQKLGDEVMGRLRAAFPDPKFVVTQLRSCFEFYQAPKRRDRAPATAATWERALRSWMEKNWIDHVARSAPDPVAAMRAQWEIRASGLIAVAHRAVTEEQFLEEIDPLWHDTVTAIGGFDRLRRVGTALGTGESNADIGAALAQFCNTAAATSGASA